MLPWVSKFPFNNQMFLSGFQKPKKTFKIIILMNIYVKLYSLKLELYEFNDRISKNPQKIYLIHINFKNLQKNIAGQNQCNDENSSYNPRTGSCECNDGFLWNEDEQKCDGKIKLYILSQTHKKQKRIASDTLSKVLSNRS